MDTAILSAIISGSIAFLGILISTLITHTQHRNQLKFQIKEFELKTREFETHLVRQSKDFELKTKELELVTNQLTSE